MLTGRSAERRAPSASSIERRAPSLRTAARLIGAVAAGLALYATFPPLGQWWLAPLAVALLLAVVDGVPSRRSGSPIGVLPRLLRVLGLAAVFAVAYQYPLLRWTGEYVGAVWLLLLVALTLIVAVTVAGMALVGRLPGAPRWFVPLGQACVWVAGEALLERWPFQGFPWAKLAFGQPGGVFAPLASLGGAPLVSFAAVLTGTSLVAVVHAVRGVTSDRGTWTELFAGDRFRSTRRDHPGKAAPGSARGWPGVALAVIGVLVGPLAGLATLPSTRAAPPSQQQQTITVAAVQGNVPRAGLDFNAQRRAVLDNHVAQTRVLVADVRAGARPRPDLVIWPENSSDIDPFRNADARAEIQQVTDEVGVPVVVGAVQAGLEDTDGTVVRGPQNSAVLWLPGTGPAASYVKRHLLPFGEYIPFRPIARLVDPSDVDRVTDFEPGTGSGVLATGPARLGVATCYEVVFDSSVRDTVLGGADLLIVPTNNATFGYTAMTYQQQGMSRIRAIEHDRTVVIAATSGQSAIVDPAGVVVARTGPLFTPGLLDMPVSLRTTTTWATRLGPAPELGLTIVGVVAVMIAVAGGIRGRRRNTSGTGREHGGGTG